MDSEWNLNRCLLNVVTVPSLDSDGALQQAVISCLSDWHLEDRLFTLTLDQSYSDESINESLRALFSVRNPYVLHGQLLIGNCFARVISLLAQEALWVCGENFRYEETLFHLNEQLKDSSLKDIFIDDQTKWNTTYDMLLVACELKQLFLCLETVIPDYNIAPSMDDWKQIEFSAHT
ncbi:zinc finger BED domain-containing protein DAYSLEEPER-like isoform X1 [Hibiscus syriacus]|uniref:zinc finger BED domain-containing protein DAYSLEEPER-like isoform X1 n=1 Tax=Hibiscus syriacus TaxID=106335 RepID=UPI001920C57D|nr:zinc finger BED domain-containing protein DAYSLEEPER-like isoform X1 [Hibiscus syriacus]